MSQLSIDDSLPPSPSRILVVEDNIINQKVVVRMVEKLGHRVDVAGNGREALEAAFRTPYDLILMDFQMPEMGGIEATMAIRQRESQGGQYTSIIAMTADAMASALEQGRQAGMDGYISKPMTQSALQETLTTWIHLRKA